MTAFFSAHTHETVFDPIQSDSGAVLVEAGNDAYLGRMDITVKTSRSGASIRSIKWQMLDVDDSVAEDPAMKKLVDAERAPYLAKKRVHGCTTFHDPDADSTDRYSGWSYSQLNGS